MSDLYYIYLGFKKEDPFILFNKPESEDDLNKSYKELLKKFHPDKFASSGREDFEWANKLFILIKEYKDLLESSIKKDIRLGAVDIDITLDKKSIHFEEVIHEGELGLVVRNGKHVLKILRNPEDSDLYKNGEVNVGKLTTHEHFKKYLISGFRPVNVTLDGVIHPAHYYNYVDGYTLNEVKAKYTNTTAPHSTWMLNRILEILSFSHSKGIANMAVLPRHVLIIPETHGAVLLDWNYSTLGKPIAVAETKGFGRYPEWVFDKPDDVRYADIIMAFDIYKWLAGEDNIPDDIRRFYKNIYNGYYRGRDTIEIYKRFQGIVDSVWSRKFMPFKM